MKRCVFPNSKFDDLRFLEAYSMRNEVLRKSRCLPIGHFPSILIIRWVHVINYRNTQPIVTQAFPSFLWQIYQSHLSIGLNSGRIFNYFYEFRKSLSTVRASACLSECQDDANGVISYAYDGCYFFVFVSNFGS